MQRTHHGKKIFTIYGRQTSLGHPKDVKETTIHVAWLTRRNILYILSNRSYPLKEAV